MTTEAAHVRARRNHNPGNLNSGQPWQGLLPRAQMNAEQKAEPRFAVFKSDAYGFRALCKTLLAYQFTHGLDTVEKIIGRWAPPSENNTGGYVSRVCSMIGHGADDRLDLKDPATLTAFARAISTVEVGVWAFDPADLDAGVKMALA